MGGGRNTMKCFCKAFISLRTLSGSSIGIAASWNGTLAPPSKYDPQDPIALMNSYIPISPVPQNHPESETDLRSHNPRDSPTRQSKPLSKPINNQHIILIHILDILRRTNRRPVTIASIIIPAIEFIHDQCRSVSADILDLCELGILDDFSGGVAGVGGEDYGGAAGDFLGDLVGVDMVSVGFCEGTGDCCELFVVSYKHFLRSNPT
jgi:hypothetical protein